MGLSQIATYYLKLRIGSHMNTVLKKKNKPKEEPESRESAYKIRPPTITCSTPTRQTMKSNRNQNLRRACLWKEIDWTGSSPSNRRPSSSSSSSSSEEPPVSPRTAGDGPGPGPSAERRCSTAPSTAGLRSGTSPGSETPARETRLRVGVGRRKLQCPACQRIACEFAFERDRHVNTNATCVTAHTCLAREMQAEVREQGKPETASPETEADFSPEGIA
ncbi:uncharacterized protein L3040_009463 [Drepanopeziza brunnea f. sp. 'multigermtubi']|uniref:uncharacterized protein n=1 Tax=Drepanopeziza brunnea f. sp. 'multigermtubi' TaxID=698441 RepID=UPI00238DF8BE|nr:hypothetical protein L3040_009463 [Drepanopeziza brunnea f. sp. 'multigermtubi']